MHCSIRILFVNFSRFVVLQQKMPSLAMVSGVMPDLWNEIHLVKSMSQNPSVCHAECMTGHTKKMVRTCALPKFQLDVQFLQF